MTETLFNKINKKLAEILYIPQNNHSDRRKLHPMRIQICTLVSYKTSQIRNVYKSFY